MSLKFLDSIETDFYDYAQKNLSSREQDLLDIQANLRLCVYYIISEQPLKPHEKKILSKTKACLKRQKLSYLLSKKYLENKLNESDSDED